MKTSRFSSELWLARQLWNRIHVQNTNAIVGIFGLPGTGKSYAQFRIQELVDPTFGIDRVAWTVRDFMHLRNGPPHLPRGSGIALDDLQRAANSRKWQSPANQALSDTANTFRFEGYLVTVTARESATIDSQFRELFHLTLEVKSRDMARGIITAKPQVPTLDTARGKTYWHYPLVDIPGMGRSALRVVHFHAGRLQTGPLRTWTEYERRKAAFMRSGDRRLEKELQDEEKMGGSVPLWARKLIVASKSRGFSYRSMAKEIGISQSALSQLVSQLKSAGE